ncbi:hypothetical protein GCWU000246_00811 [Jonquetella anthropi E3_33 E1]|nr:hypothetical protein GCWU000246_00811 [Jonquetella anthropi E3_33 E1]
MPGANTSYKNFVAFSRPLYSPSERVEGLIFTFLDPTGVTSVSLSPLPPFSPRSSPVLTLRHGRGFPFP